MGAMGSQITSLTIVYSIVHSGVDQRKHQSSTSLAFVRGIHRWPMNSPHKWPVTWKMIPFDEVIMNWPCHTGPPCAVITPRKPMTLTIVVFRLYRWLSERLQQSIANAVELLQSCTKPSIYQWNKSGNENRHVYEYQGNGDMFPLVFDINDILNDLHFKWGRNVDFISNQATLTHQTRLHV